MSEPRNLPELEAALIDRAERLAAEYIDHGRDGREAILRDERDRLRVREERISQEARAHADRLYRRRVQAAELRLHGIIDQQRWELIRSVMKDLPDQLAAFADDEEAYDTFLRAMLTHAAESIGDEKLVATFNTRDRERLDNDWQAFCKKALPGHQVELATEAVDCSGGVRVSSSDNEVSVDATFEGRMERFGDELMQVIAERLFASEIHHGS